MNDFVNYDDVRFVVSNNMIRKLSAENIKEMFTPTSFEYEMLYGVPGPSNA